MSTAPEEKQQATAKANALLGSREQTNAPPDDAVLWRYMDFPKFVNVLVTGELYFCRLGAFQDQFEGKVPAGTLKVLAAGINPDDSAVAMRQAETYASQLESFARTLLYVNCWCCQRHESAALWAQYGHGYPVAFRTTAGRLRSQMNTEGDRLISVTYADESLHELPVGSIFNLASWKRAPFDHEREVRLVRMSDSGKGIGVSLPFDVSNGVEEIVIGPQSPHWLIDTAIALTKQCGVSTPVRRSRL